MALWRRLERFQNCVALACLTMPLSIRLELRCPHLSDHIPFHSPRTVLPSPVWLRLSIREELHCPYLSDHAPFHSPRAALPSPVWPRPLLYANNCTALTCLTTPHSIHLGPKDSASGSAGSPGGSSSAAHTTTRHTTLSSHAAGWIHTAVSLHTSDCRWIYYKLFSYCTYCLHQLYSLAIVLAC